MIKSKTDIFFLAVKILNLSPLCIWARKDNKK